MSEFLVKGKHFITNHVWFQNADEFSFGGGYDNIVCHANPKAIDKIGTHKCNATVQHTLITDLSVSEEGLWSSTTKTVRNEINRCKREQVATHVYIGEEITENLLIEFSAMYTAMYEEKGMSRHILNINELKAYKEKNALIITTADIDGNNVVFHSYIHVGNKSRFLQSCSEFRVQDNSMRNAIGRANKYLHWNDWLLLKNLGVEEYDWGGIASYENPNGIDKFKMAFGGEYRKYYNISCTCSIRARLYGIVRNMKRRICC